MEFLNKDLSSTSLLAQISWFNVTMNQIIIFIQLLVNDNILKRLHGFTLHFEITDKI